MKRDLTVPAAFIRERLGAERRSALLLLLALGVVFAVGSSPGRFHLWTGDHGDVTLNCLTHAANLSPEHGLRRFYYQFLNSAGEHVYDAYNPLLPYETASPTSLPIGGILLVRAAVKAFPDNLAAQFRAARTLMLAFFAAAVVAAYLALARLTASPSIALAATLLAFSSFGTLHYADMVGTEGSPDLFAVMLTFHGLVVFVQERRWPGLLAKIFVAVLIGWHVFALLLAFVVLGLAAQWLRGHGGLLRRTTRLLRSRHLLLGAIALSLGGAVLALNFAMEIAAAASEGSLARGIPSRTPAEGSLARGTPSRTPAEGSFARGSPSRTPAEGSFAKDAEEQAFVVPYTAWLGAERERPQRAETTLEKLPSYRSMARAVGWDPHAKEWSVPSFAWAPLLELLLNRAGRASIPYAVERAGRLLFGSPPAGGVQAHRGVADLASGKQLPTLPVDDSAARRDDAGSRSLAKAVFWWGVVVFVATAIGMAFVRHRILWATLAGCGFCWGALVNVSASHPYEGMFLVGLPLALCSLVLVYARWLLQRHRLSERWIDACAGAAFLVFALSGMQVGQLAAEGEETSHFQALLADMEAVRHAAPEGAIMIGHTFSRGEMRYLTVDRVLLHALNGRQRPRADFVLARARLADAGLLTPENRFIFLYDRAAYDARYATLGDPLFETANGWKVHFMDNRLVVTSGEACDARQGYEREPALFVESFPTSRRVAPFYYYDAPPLARRTEFGFRESGFEVAGRCVAEVAPPAYDVGRLRIGQFVPGEGTVWSATLSLALGRLRSLAGGMP